MTKDREVDSFIRGTLFGIGIGAAIVVAFILIFGV